jgi:hypothetical protein
MSGNLSSTLGYKASPDLIRGSPSAQAVATGQANIQATTARNAATGGRRHRKYRTNRYRANKYRGGASTIPISPLSSTTNSYPTQYPASTTQQNLVSAQVANNVNGQGDGLNGGSKKYKRNKFSKKRFFNKLIGSIMKKRKSKRNK